MSKLFSEFQVKSLTLKNRIVMAPMCMFCAGKDGLVTPWHVTHYASRAVGGVGLIILEATAVEPRGRISDADLGIWSDAHVKGLKAIVDQVHASGSKIAIQLAHAGSKCSVKEESIISASALQFTEKYATPKEMTQNDIEDVVEAFKVAAKRAVDAGFDAIEIHGAHGYLIHQFLSPVMNKRQDVFGGNLDNRLRFAREVLRALKSVTPKEMPIFMRVSAEDYVPEGNRPETIGEMLGVLKSEGLDVAHVSSGGASSEGVEVFPAYQVPMACTVKAISKLPTIAGGMIQTAELAEAILCQNQADLIFIGRPLLRDPYFALRAMKALKEENILWPTPYHRAVQ